MLNRFGQKLEDLICFSQARDLRYENVVLLDNLLAKECWLGGVFKICREKNEVSNYAVGLWLSRRSNVSPDCDQQDCEEGASEA